MISSSSFAERVHMVVKRIPAGSTLSYSEVAAEAGFPGAARAVGSLLKKNFDPTIPCHRVIRAHGIPGAYNRGAKKKIALLKKEGALS